MALFRDAVGPRAPRTDGTDTPCQPFPGRVPLAAAPSRRTHRRQARAGLDPPHPRVRAAWPRRHASRHECGWVRQRHRHTKQEQHQRQQGSSHAPDIGTPLHKVRVFVAKTDIDVPAIVIGRVLGREADRKGAKAVKRTPAAGSDKLVECVAQLRRICYLSARFFPPSDENFHPKADVFSRPSTAGCEDWRAAWLVDRRLTRRDRRDSRERQVHRSAIRTLLARLATNGLGADISVKRNPICQLRRDG